LALSAVKSKKNEPKRHKGCAKGAKGKKTNIEKKLSELRGKTWRSLRLNLKKMNRKDTKDAQRAQKERKQISKKNLANFAEKLGALYG